jgi:ABC-2 type transport system permease protein
MLKFLIEKEFKQILRNPFLPRMIIVFPLVVVLLLPYAANYEIRNINLALIDNDRSPYSRQLAEKVTASGYFRLTRVSENYLQALRSIDLDHADIILEIPPRFESELVRERSARVMISANAVNGIKGGLGSAYLARIVTDFGSEVRAQWVPLLAQTGQPNIEIVPHFRFNPHMEYPVFMIPALMVMLLAMLCGFLPALNIVGEKESGTIEQMNATPVTKFNFILSKLIPYWIIGFLVLSISFGVARLFWGLIPSGSLLTIYVLASVFVLAISGFGLVISNHAKTIQQAMFMMFFFVMAFVLMSGLYTPVSSMPEWAQLLSRFSPLRYFIEIMRLVYLKGSSLSDLWGHFLALSAFAVFFNSWAVMSYRKTG